MRNRMKAAIFVVAVGVVLGYIVRGMNKAISQEIIRIEDLKGKGIEITAVEFTRTSPIQCDDLAYFHKYDPDENGIMEGCQNLKYDPCESHDSHRQLTIFWRLGGNCDAKPKPVLNCDFSPRPAGCL